MLTLANLIPRAFSALKDDNEKRATAGEEADFRQKWRKEEQDSLFCALAAEMLNELGGVDRLGKELEGIATRSGAGKNFKRCRLTGEEHDTRVRAELRDLDSNFDAVNVRHQYVRKDKLRAGTARHLDGLCATVGCFGDEAIAIQDLNNSVRDEDFIVDDEDAWCWSLALEAVVCV
jgi:hypothetical protein